MDGARCFVAEHERFIGSDDVGANAAVEPEVDVAAADAGVSGADDDGVGI